MYLAAVVMSSLIVQTMSIDPFIDLKEGGELHDIELIKEIEKIVASLDSEQLDKLENILAKDEKEEFSLLLSELKEMGMEEEDIQDLDQLANMMNAFLLGIPRLSSMLKLVDDPYSLKDHVKLYLLGLPNKLGPLGFVSLHSVLFGEDDSEDDIVDVKVGEFVADSKSPISANQADASQPKEAAKKAADGKAPVTTVGDIIARRRRSILFDHFGSKLTSWKTSIRNQMALKLINKLAKLPYGPVQKKVLDFLVKNAA